jgi:hypothetical protein
LVESEHATEQVTFGFQAVVTPFIRANGRAVLSPKLQAIFVTATQHGFYTIIIASVLFIYQHGYFFPVKEIKDAEALRL